MGKVVSLRQLVKVRRALRKTGKVVVFTNGTFDILHRGHVEYLTRAGRMGDVLMVGLNSDESIRRIKGKGRPINPASDRAVVLGAIGVVDYVCLFRDDTPFRMIAALKPDILVKGADWNVEEIVGRDIVEAGGGKVRSIPLTPGRSTTTMIQRILRTGSGK